MSDFIREDCIKRGNRYTEFNGSYHCDRPQQEDSNLGEKPKAPIVNATSIAEGAAAGGAILALCAALGAIVTLLAGVMAIYALFERDKENGLSEHDALKRRCLCFIATCVVLVFALMGVLTGYITIE